MCVCSGEEMSKKYVENNEVFIWRQLGVETFTPAMLKRKKTVVSLEHKYWHREFVLPFLNSSLTWYLRVDWYLIKIEEITGEKPSVRPNSNDTMNNCWMKWSSMFFKLPTFSDTFHWHAFEINPTACCPSLSQINCLNVYLRMSSGSPISCHSLLSFILPSVWSYVQNIQVCLAQTVVTVSSCFTSSCSSPTLHPPDITPSSELPCDLLV